MEFLIKPNKSNHMNSPPPPSSAFAALSHDVLRSHILTRLDAPSLASFACASSELHALSADDHLWQKISAATWPSINHPLISTVISTFPSGHRSFFSDAFPLIHHHRHSPATSTSPETTELISAVDIYYRNSPVFSKVEKTETTAGWFNTSPFRVDLLGPKEFVPTWMEDARIHELEEYLTLSWIVVDPVNKRAVNLSSRRAVGVQRHWLTGELQVKFAVVMAGEPGSEREHVKCEAVVTCGGGGVHVREVSMTMEDLEGKGVNGKESMGILKGAMERGERRKVGGKGKESKERYKEFLVRRERKLEHQRQDRVMDWVCMATGINCFLAFCSYVVFG